MTSNAVNNRCENCLELQRSLVKTLGEKRSLLLRLQKEQSRVRKLLREAEKGKKRDGEVWSLIHFCQRYDMGRQKFHLIFLTDALTCWQLDNNFNGPFLDPRTFLWWKYLLFRSMSGWEWFSCWLAIIYVIQSWPCSGLTT